MAQTISEWIRSSLMAFGANHVEVSSDGFGGRVVAITIRPETVVLKFDAYNANNYTHIFYECRQEMERMRTLIKARERLLR